MVRKHLVDFVKGFAAEFAVAAKAAPAIFFAPVVGAKAVRQQEKRTADSSNLPLFEGQLLSLPIGFHPVCGRLL